MEFEVIIAVFYAIFKFTSNNVCLEPGDDHNEKSTEDNKMTTEYNKVCTEYNEVCTEYNDVNTEYNDLSTEYMNECKKIFTHHPLSFVLVCRKRLRAYKGHLHCAYGT